MLGPPSNHVTRHGWCVLEGVNINTTQEEHSAMEFGGSIRFEYFN